MEKEKELARLRARQKKAQDHQAEQVSSCLPAASLALVLLTTILPITPVPLLRML